MKRREPITEVTNTKSVVFASLAPVRQRLPQSMIDDNAVYQA